MQQVASRNFTSATEPEVRVPPPRQSIQPSANHEYPWTRSKRKTSSLMESENEDNGNRAPLHPDCQDTSETNFPASRHTTSNKKARRGSSSTDFQKQIKDLESEKKSLETRVKRLESSLKSVTRESVLNAKRGTKDVWDQAKIETEFKSLKNDIKKWVRKYGTTDKISSFSNSEKRDILSACAEEAYQNVFSEDDFFAIQGLQRGAQLLLEGFLFSKSIFDLINRPFVFIDAVLQQHSNANRGILAYGNHESLFTEFADELSRCETYPDQGQRWTASMLQSMKRMIIPEPPDDIASHQKTEKWANSSYRIYELGISQLVKDFLQYGKAIKPLLNDRLMKDEHKQRGEGLKMIYRKFRELAYHMWCQPSTITCPYGPGLFDPETMELDSWSCQARQENGTDRLKGSKVLINLSPAIAGEIIDPDGSKKPLVIYLPRRVWTVDCQTFKEWKASQKECPSPSAEILFQDTSHAPPSNSDVHNGSSPEARLENALVDDECANAPQAHEPENTNDTTLSPPDIHPDAGPDFPAHFGVLPDAQSVAQSKPQ